MSTTAKVAYLKGLAEGMELDREKKEGKLISAIIDILEEMALDIEDLEENTLELTEELDEISDDLSELEELCFGDEYDDDEDDEPYVFNPRAKGGHGAGCCCADDEDEESDNGEPVFYEITCPACGNTITVDEDVLLLEEIDCPNCGELLEFDIEEEDDDEDEDEE